MNHELPNLRKGTRSVTSCLRILEKEKRIAAGLRPKCYPVLGKRQRKQLARLLSRPEQVIAATRRPVHRVVSDAVARFLGKQAAD